MKVAYVIRLFRYSIIYSLLCLVGKVNIETLQQVSLLRKFFVKFAPADVFSCIRNNYPQSTHAQQNLRNIHEYGTLTDTMSLLKHIHNPTKLIPYEQIFVQTFHHLISEQSASEHNPLFQLTFDTI